MAQHTTADVAVELLQGMINTGVVTDAKQIPGLLKEIHEAVLALLERARPVSGQDADVAARYASAVQPPLVWAKVDRKPRGTVPPELKAQLKAALPPPRLPEGFNPATDCITADREWLICLEDGKKHKALTRVLHDRFGLTEAEYLERWVPLGLPEDFPMEAPAVSERRKARADVQGLGHPLNKLGFNREKHGDHWAKLEALRQEDKQRLQSLVAEGKQLLGDKWFDHVEAALDGASMPKKPRKTAAAEV